MANVLGYLTYIIVLGISYFSSILGIIIAGFAKYKKLEEKIVYIALIGSAGALFMYTIDFMYLNMK